MTSKELSKGILRSLGIIIAILLGLYFLWLIRSVIIYIFIAFALSLMGRPFMKLLHQRMKFSVNLSAIITLVSMIFLLFSFIRLSIPMITEQTQNLSLSNINELKDNIETQLNDLNESLRAHGIHFFKPEKITKSFSDFNIDVITDYFGDFFSFMGNLIISIFSVLFITFFFLKDKDLFNRIFIGLFPSKDTQKASKLMNQTKDMLSKYFLGLLLQCFIMFVLYFIILIFFGIDNAFIISLICAVFNLIPYIGPLIGAFIFTLLSMSSMYNHGMDMQNEIIPNLTYIFIGYCMAQLIDNFINQPLIYSNSVKSHPLEIFIIMLISGILFGIPGVILAVPGYTVLRLFLKNFYGDSEYVQKITGNL